MLSGVASDQEVKVLAQKFSTSELARMMGIMVAVNTFGHATGEPIASLVYEQFGSYNLILFVYAGIMAGVLVLFQLVMKRAGRDRDEIVARHQAAVAAE